MKTILTFVSSTLVLCLVAGCPSDDNGDSPPATAESDAQYICEALTHCFGLTLGPRCALDIEATTVPEDITRCADCYGTATCDEIGAPGEPGVCDLACHNALFGVQ